MKKLLCLLAIMLPCLLYAQSGFTWSEGTTDGIVTTPAKADTAKYLRSDTVKGIVVIYMKDQTPMRVELAASQIFKVYEEKHWGFSGESNESPHWIRREIKELVKITNDFGSGPIDLNKWYEFIPLNKLY